MPLSHIEISLLAAGFNAAPNNIHSLPGREWYASGPNIATVKHAEEIRVIDGHLSVWTTKYYQRPDNTFNFHISGVVAEIDSMEGLKKYCQDNGRVSGPGLPPFANDSWD